MKISEAPTCTCHRLLFRERYFLNFSCSEKWCFNIHCQQLCRILLLNIVFSQLYTLLILPYFLFYTRLAYNLHSYNQQLSNLKIVWTWGKWVKYPHDESWTMKIWSLFFLPTRLENYISSKASVITVKFLFSVGRMDDLIWSFSFRCSGTANGWLPVALKCF